MMNASKVPLSAWHLFLRFAPYLGNWRVLIAATLLLVVLAPLVGGGLLWLLKLMVDEVLLAGRLDLLAPFAGVYGILVALRATLEYGQLRLESTVAEGLVRDLRVDLYAHLVSLSPGSLRDRGAGDLIAHLSGDVERLEGLIYSVILSILDDVAHVIFYLIFLLALSWKLTLLSLVVVPLLVLAAVRFAPRVRRAHRITRRRASAWMALAEATLNVLPMVQAFRGERYETDRLAAASRRLREAELGAVSIQAMLSFVIEIAAAAGSLLLVVVGAMEMQRGALTLGTLAAFIGSLGSLYGPIRGLARTSGRVQRAAAGAQRVATLLDTPSRVRERPVAKPVRDVRGRVAFERVSFSYPSGPEVLSEIDLVIEPGQTVALVGASGGGKSTLVQLLLRLHDPDAGRVTIDGHDLRTLTLSSVRDAIAVVFQEAHLLRDTITANIV